MAINTRLQKFQDELDTYFVFFIFNETPRIFALKVFRAMDNQDPTNPVFPNINTFLFFKFLNI